MVGQTDTHYCYAMPTYAGSQDAISSIFLFKLFNKTDHRERKGQLDSADDFEKGMPTLRYQAEDFLTVFKHPGYDHRTEPCSVNGGYRF